MSARGAAVCWLVAGVAYPSLEAAAATGVPGYRYAHDFISDLGRPDSPLSYLVNTAFVVQGTLFFVASVLLARAERNRPYGLFVGFAAANAVGNVIVATVPSGSAGIAWVHVSAAVLAIVGGNAAILTGSPLVSAHRAYRAASVGLAALGLLSFVLLAIAATTSVTMMLPSAVWERTSVYTIIGWQVLSAVVLLARQRK
ncbi:MAG: conserved rane protein [Mycobacterium sp.]|nr:conserved rane protein [Mycobacterium sp.]